MYVHLFTYLSILIVFFLYAFLDNFFSPSYFYCLVNSHSISFCYLGFQENKAYLADIRS